MNYYVDNTNSAGGNGASWSQAWNSFSAINWAVIKPGDTIYVSGGATSQTYNETLTVGASGSAAGAITITKGTDPGHNGNVVIDGGNTLANGVAMYGQNYVVVNGLSVENISDAGFSVKNATAGVVLENNSVYSGDPGGGNARGYDVRNCVGTNAVIVTNNSFSTPANTAAQTDGIYSSGNSGVVFESNKIIISNSNTTGHSDCFQSYQDGNIIVRDNWFEQANTATVNNHGAWIADTLTGGVVQFYNNIVSVPNLTGDAAVTHYNEPSWTGTGTIEIWNNTIIGGHRSVNLSGSPNAQVYNNILEPSAGGFGVVIAGAAPPAANINYNLIWAPSGTIAYVGSNNLSWSQWQAVGYDAHGVNADPMFISLASENYSLAAGSPAINSGLNIPGITTDYAGMARPQGGAYDIGALESSATAAPSVTIALVSDTGASAPDGITANDALIGSGYASAVVVLAEGSTLLGTTIANATGVWGFNPTSLSQGTHTVVASETDMAGNVFTASLTFTYDTIAPAVTESLVSDTGASSTDNTTANDALTGSGDPNAGVILTEGTTVLGTTIANATGVWSFTPTSLSQGTHTIVASETDLAGNVGTASLTLTYDTIAPAVTEHLVSDTGASSTDNNTANDALTGSGDPNAAVILTEGTTVLGTTIANATGVWSFTPTSLSQGKHTIVASETDLAGNVGTASLTLTYDTIAPAVTEHLVSDTGASSTDNNTANDALTGSGDPNAAVTLTEGTTILGSTTANAAGVWSFSPISLSQGTHTIVASETDLAGNVGKASLTFSNDPLAPIGFAFAPDTAHLLSLEGSTRRLSSNTSVGTFTETGGNAGDSYTFTITGATKSFVMTSGLNIGKLSTGSIGPAGVQLYAETVQVLDTTTAASSGPRPFDVVVGSSNGDTINLEKITHNLGISTATPTLVYGLGGNDTINGTGMTSRLWVAVGTGVDHMTGGSGGNTYMFASATESTPNMMDIITNFVTARDLIDLTGLNDTLSYAGQLTSAATALKGNSVGWQQSGKNTFVYVNTSGATESLGSTNMKIELVGMISLSEANILHY